MERIIYIFKVSWWPKVNFRHWRQAFVNSWSTILLINWVYKMLHYQMEGNQSTTESLTQCYLSQSIFVILATHATARCITTTGSCWKKKMLAKRAAGVKAAEGLLSVNLVISAVLNLRFVTWNTLLQILFCSSTPLHFRGNYCTFNSSKFIWLL